MCWLIEAPGHACALGWGAHACGGAPATPGLCKHTPLRTHTHKLPAAGSPLHGHQLVCAHVLACRQRQQQPLQAQAVEGGQQQEQQQQQWQPLLRPSSCPDWHSGQIPAWTPLSTWTQVRLRAAHACSQHTHTCTPHAHTHAQTHAHTHTHTHIDTPLYTRTDAHVWYCAAWSGHVPEAFCTRNWPGFETDGLM